jgi:hypothetical protein
MKRDILGVLLALVLVVSFGLVMAEQTAYANPEPPAYASFAEAKSGGTSTPTTVTSITVDKPAGTVDGNLLVAVVTWDADSGPGTVGTVPNGWTQLYLNKYTYSGSEVEVGVWWKIASSEGASYTWGWSTAEAVYAYILRITGNDTSNPINAWGITADGSSSYGTSPTCPTVTTTVADTLILRLFGSDRGMTDIDGDYPSGHTGITVDRAGPAASGCSCGGAAYKTQAAAGATGTATFGPYSYYGGSNHAHRSFTLAIAPASTTEPTITISGTPLSAFSSEPGTPSAQQSYTVSGSNLTEDIEIAAPTDFEISTTSGSDYASTLKLSQSGGSVAATPVYVRFNRTTAGTSSGNIVHTSSGATTQNVAVSGTAGTAAGWTAYNDGGYIDGQISTNITTYACYTNGTSGLLKNYADGSNTPVTMTVTTSGTVSSQLTSSYYGAEPNSGTDAYTTFHDFANMVGGMRLGTANSYIDLTFTGLDPADNYTFATTANRADSGYTNRITKFTISDVETATNAGTSGVTVNSNLSVSFCTGYNTVNGYVARWTGIQPGSDGDFKVRLEVDSSGTTYAYGPAVFMLADESGGPTNQAPNQPTLVRPTDGVTDVPTTPTLEVTVTDPNADNLDVTFYGRADGTVSGEDFTIVVIPDTQNESQYYPSVFNSQTQWIVANKDAQNIVFVTNVGDIVNTASDTTQWSSADAAMDYLDSGNVAYSVGPGNHDLGGLYETYFGVSRFTGKSWYGGHYGADNYNNYSLFSAGGMDFILVNLQYSSTTAMLDWADALLKANPNRRGIVVQHDILNIDNSWVNQTPYTALKDNPNLFLMLCGHMHSASDGAAYRAELGDDGHTIHIMQADYQDYPNGGNGYLRILRFSSANDMIYATTYSPYASASPTNITTSPDQMNMAYVMGGSAVFEVIGTAPGVASGSNASVTWPDLDPNTEHEWYVEVTDGSQTITGPVWSFTTGGSDTNPPGQPTLVSPGSWETINHTYTLDWDNVIDDASNPVTYDLQVWNFDWTLMALSKSGLTTSDCNLSSEPLADGTYWWIVRAVDAVGNVGEWASGGPFTLDTIAPGQPTLSSPGSWVKINHTYTMDWTDVIDDASNPVTYDLQVWNFDWTLMALSKSGLTTSDCNLSSEPLADGTYWWIVRAMDGAGNVGDWAFGGPFVLVSDTNPPGQPTLLSPGSWERIDHSYTLDWTDVIDDASNPATYDLLVFNFDWSSMVVVQGGLTPSEYNLSSETLADGTYWWIVRAVDGAGNIGEWAFGGPFVLVSDMNPPGQPTLQSPGIWETIGPSYTLDWTDVIDDASNPVTYDLLVFNFDWSSMVVVQGGLTPSEYNLSSETLADGTYWLIVRAVDGAGNVGEWAFGGPFILDNSFP